LAVGKIRECPASTDGTISFSMEDQLVTLVNATLKRDIFFSDSDWIGEIQDLSKSDTSASYDSDADGAGIELVNDFFLNYDQTFVIEFTAPTTFKIITPAGSDAQTGDINNDCDVYEDGGVIHFGVIHQEGWSKEPGAYAAGDRFVFYTAYGRTASQLGAVGLIHHIIQDVVNLQVYDFDTGGFVTPFWDAATWASLIAETEPDYFAGFHAKGKRVIDMIQGIMPVNHISLFPQPNGQLAIWMLEPPTAADIYLNFDPAVGDVSILSGTSNQRMTEVYNRISYSYLAMSDGKDVEYESTDPDTPYDEDLALELDLGWRIRPLSVETGVDRAIRRFKKPPKGYSMATTFDGAAIEVGNIVAINAPVIGASNAQASAVAVGMDPMNDTALVEAIEEEIFTAAPVALVGDDDEAAEVDGIPEVW
jgi:hypothetical protein